MQKIDDKQETIMKEVKPTLKSDEILGATHEGSPAGMELLSNYNLAKEALEKTDAAELFVLYEKAVRDRAEIEQVFLKGFSHFVGSKDKPRYESNNDNAIAAMERVALAAIELARMVALGNEKDGK